MATFRSVDPFAAAGTSGAGALPSALDAVAGEIFARARAAAGDHPALTLRVGTHRLALRFDGPASTGAVLPAWRPLLSDDAQPVDGEILVVTAARAGRAPSLPDFSGAARLASRGAPVVRSAGAIELWSRPETGTLALWDGARNRGVWWVSSAEALAVAERIVPLGPLMRWMPRSFGLQTVDGAVLGSAKGGLLLLGPAGSGRTTAAMAARRVGLAPLADDVAAIDATTATAYPLTGFASVTERTLHLLPELFGRLAQLPPTRAGKHAVVLDARPLRCLEGMPLLAAVLMGGSPAGGAPVQFDDDAARAALAQYAAPSGLPATLGPVEAVSGALASLPVFGVAPGVEPDALAAALAGILRELTAAAAG